MGRALYHWKAKEHANWISGWGDKAQKVPRLKVGNSRECLEVTPDPKGGKGVPAKGWRSICMEGGVVHSSSAIVNPLPELAGESLT